MPTKKYSKSELEDWVKTWNISDDKKASVLSTLGDDEIVSHLGEGVLSRRESDRLYREYQDEKKAIETKQKEVLDLESQLVAWRDENNPKFEAAVEERDRLKAERDALVNAYIAKGGSLTDLGKPVEGEPKKDPPPRDDDGRFVSRDDYEKSMKTMVPALAGWTAQAMQIDRMHFELTGQHPDLDKVLTEVYKGKPAIAAWEETHGIAAIRETKREEDVQKRIDAAVKDREAQLRTELIVDPAARRDDGASKGFNEALASLGQDPAIVGKADAASRSRAVSALDGFDPYS